MCLKVFWGMLDIFLVDNDTGDLATGKRNGTNNLLRIAILALWCCGCIVINRSQLISQKEHRRNAEQGIP